LDGESATFHSNGVQATSIQYRNGVKDGKETWWSDKGLKTYAANHLDGKLHGATYSWNERGYLISEAKFDNGNPVRPTSYAE
jgi:antitoxin component YwqK of YwqJK toxin-antitoxin module